jgi:predicted dehydrogenase
MQQVLRMRTIGWGIIGAGDVCEVKSGPAFQRVAHSRLIAVMRRNEQKAEDFARRHGVPKWYSQGQTLIDDPEIDAIYIATPPESHKDYTLQVAAAGKPVYVEKPMARTYDECRLMIDACQSAHTPLFVAYYRRSLPRFQKVRQLLNSHRLGTVRLITVHLYQPAQKNEHNSSTLPWRVIPEIAGGGHFVDLASHTLDLLDFLFGPIIKVQGLATNQAGLYPAEDIVCTNYLFDSGVLASCAWCFTAYHTCDEVQIIGDRGKLIFSTFGDGPIQLISKSQNQTWSIRNPKHIQEPHIDSIVKQLLGNGHCPSMGESAARTNWVMDESLRLWRREQKIHFK